MVKTCLEENPQEEIAFVFGTERSGLTNEEMMLCQLCTAIPANPECDSLNLAQAVQVTAYQLSRHFAEEPWMRMPAVLKVRRPQVWKPLKGSMNTLKRQ